MPQSEPISILLVNEIAEEIKLTTLSFRGFFPNCRIEAVYSLEEAIQWAPRAAWHLILLDDNLLTQRATSILPELKRLVPAVVLVLQTERSDSTSALNALHAGADFLLYKKSPAFLTELVLYTRDAFEKRDLRLTLDRTQERYGRLVDALNDVVYELDTDGRFTYVSPLITRILGYSQEELLGTPYSAIVPSDQLNLARHCFNDRRTGTRASRQIELDLIRKPSPDSPSPARIRIELSAKGLYDSERRYRGALGILRDVSQHRRQEATIHHLEHQLQETDRLLTLSQRLSTLSTHLHDPHQSIRTHAQLLVQSIRESRLVEHAESLAASAAEALRIGADLVHAATEITARRKSVNDLIDTVLAATPPPFPNTGRIERSYTPTLPPFGGDSDTVMQLLRVLFSYAQRHLATTGSRHGLQISTRIIEPPGAPTALDSTSRTPEPVAEIEVRLQETDTAVAEEGPADQTPSDVFDAYALVKQLGGRLELLAPAGGFFSITVWIPARSTPPPNSDPGPPPLPVAWPHTHAEPSSVATPHAEPFLPQPQSVYSPASPPLPDRRTHIRIATSLPARVAIGNTVREGTLTDLNSRGATVELAGRLPLLAQQPALFTLKTAAGVFELHATAHDRGMTTQPTTGGVPASRLAFLFTALTNTEHKILESYVGEARARTLDATVDVLLMESDTLEQPDAIAGESQLRGTDHRETLRVRVTLPVRVGLSSLGERNKSLLGLVINFSRGGLCFQTSGPLGSVGDPIAVHFSSTSHLGQPRAHEPDVPEAILDGRIVYMTPDQTVPSELRGGPTQPGQRIGIRFFRLTPFAEREINRVIAQHVGSSMILAGTVGRSSIVSARRECRNVRHQVIAVTDDHARHQISPTTPIVIIAPGFGLTQTDYLPLSFYLAANRFRVLRYDHTNHIGQSDGDLLQTTLRGMQTDLQAVLDFVATTWPAASLTLLAEDLAARVALKVLAQGKTADQLLLVNPVFDIEMALSTLFQTSTVEHYRQGVRKGIANLWGLNINLDQFIGDAIAGEYTDMASMATDLAKLVLKPVVVTSPGKHRHPHRLFGPQDQSFRALGPSLTIVPMQADLSSESNVYDDRHADAFRAIVKLIPGSSAGSLPTIQTSEPTQRDIHYQRRLEQERMRLCHHVSQATRDALWIAQLNQASKISDLADYQSLQHNIYRQMLPLSPGMTVLDIGCGQSDFACTLLTNQLYHRSHHTEILAPPLMYVGLDQSDETLTHAEHRISAVLRGLGMATVSPSITQSLTMSWLRSEWGNSLPLINHSMDRVLCHLSLCFVPSPLSCVREALRVLHHNGTLVLTCFQPHTDLAIPFRRHLRDTHNDESCASAQILTHFFGRLREAVRHGLLHCYERNELVRLLLHAGAGPIQIVPILDNQLLLAVVEKGKSAG
ncbi:MAG: PAS domain S-box protein [Nitrospira sp.]|nr:PAS domain S-box protein [Nitrospira sp.]